MRALWIAVPLALLPVVYSFAAAQTAARGPSKVAYVSNNRLIAESADVRAAVARFQAAQRQRASELQTLQRTLADTRRKLAQTPAGPARTALEQQEAEQQKGLERAAAQAQTDLQASQREMQVAIQTHVRPVLEELAKEQDLDVVLNADLAVVWASQRLDLTSEVLERLNASTGEGVRKGKP